MILASDWIAFHADRTPPPAPSAPPHRRCNPGQPGGSPPWRLANTISHASEQRTAMTLIDTAAFVCPPGHQPLLP